MIVFKNISFSFDKKQLFNNFNLLIKENEKILINAPSGSGKTSLVKMLLGIIKFNGEIYLNDVLLSPKTKNIFRKNISYVSQDVDLQNLITKDLIKEILSYKVNRHIKYDEQKIEEYLNQLDLSIEHLDKLINELSGGERARIGLVISLLLNRKILIVDEITSGIDELLKHKIINFICTLDKTVIIISHDKLWENHKNIRVVGW